MARWRGGAPVATEEVDADTRAGEVEVAAEQDPGADATIRARGSAGDVTVASR